ncbi:L,D-transpeptidase [Trinickia fusca]|uniref:L,D-TPase catalytic domain-containing protein n=1 Tax=Trinickia fusca TaxID=2419777 RepID=A0A494XP90_9BURK|nr:L,D-transpeptidase [Trinickia fusca]RKP52467.1 hypothetical protein D7S89_02815 [Trinickia fusca]
MSTLKFDGNAHQISLVDSEGKTVGTWAAYNNVDSQATIRHVLNGIYHVQDRVAPHPHQALANGPYGLHGIIRFNVPGHPGIGVHSGRANARHLPGPQHPTMGCIRTSDDAMSAISNVMRHDALTTIEVTNNSAVVAHQASKRNLHADLRGRTRG